MPKLTPFLRPLMRTALTLTVVVAAAILVYALWHAYVLSPWTRDGRVSAQIVRIAPEVSGTVLKVAVADNQYVHRGDLLYRVDPARFELAIAQAEAQLAAATAALQQSNSEARRRKGMESLVAAEEIQRASQAVATARVEQRSAQIALQLAQLNLARSALYAPVDGYVTRLRLNPGDYAIEGQANIALLDAGSFWMTGYFEETKLHDIQPGATAQIRLMGFEDLIQGRVTSIGRGIADSNQQADALGLPSVEPSFSWVRLAQRIPVRVEFDQIPEGVLLAAGMTGSIEITTAESGLAPQGRLMTLLHRWM